MGERFGAPATVRVARSRPGLRAAVASTGLLVLLAILKPWAPVADVAASADDLPLPTATAFSAGALTSPSPIAAAIDQQPGPGEMTCQVEDWQIVSLDRLADWTVRTWTPAAAALATGPLDAAIPTVRLDSPRVLGLGVCAPDAGPGSDGTVEGSIAAIWRIDARRAVDLTFGPLVADPMRRPRPGITSLYRPVRDAAAWAPGHYVIAIAGGAAGAARSYLGLVVPASQ